METLQDLIALVPAPPGAVIATIGGKAERISLADGRSLFDSGNVLVAHSAYVANRLGIRKHVMLFDVLELFVFVRPGCPIVPSAMGLARALGLALPHSAQEGVGLLHGIAQSLLREVSEWPYEVRTHLAPLVATMGRSQWRWAPLLKDLVGDAPHGSPIAGLEAWRGQPQWEDESPQGQPGSQPVTAKEALGRLAQMVEVIRPEQAAYADAATYAFGPREHPGIPRVALLEAGTGTGKTLGYLAPASIWAEKNGPGLWISTYTRNLQRQIMHEIAHLWPDAQERAKKAVVRKGRENYLCLLNFEEAAKRTVLAPGQTTVVLGLLARWISSPTDGDLSGVGFPAFLGAHIGLSSVTDRRGECIYAACPHYRICFIERAIRRSRHADIVVANHALVIAQASQDHAQSSESGKDETSVPAERHIRYVFDEGHHLFDAADSGFSAMLSGREMADLRRWIRGPEGHARSRVRGLQDRLKDVIADDEVAQDYLDEAIRQSSALAGEGWHTRLGIGARGQGEAFLAAVYGHVRSRSSDPDSYYSLEAEPHPISEELLERIVELCKALQRIADPLSGLARQLRKRMNDKSASQEPYTMARLDALARGLDRRAHTVLGDWKSMLDTLAQGEISDEFADWFTIIRENGRDADVGLERHWIDPTKPLAASVFEPAHGILITSATLRDTGAEAEDHWASAEVRTGASHLVQPARRGYFGSPFHYEEQAAIFIVNDLARRDANVLACAYRELFLASGGGALGLFTSVRSLRDTASRIADDLAQADLSLYAQHIDRLDTGSLVDLFRVEENACLLGTDALRDGVDVPGRSLRLVVFDKVPWPKPSILHKARRVRFGKGYDDLITRFRLKQAFGRLIRGSEDRGCFVILEGATPSRLLTAFPENAPIKRCGLAEAIGDIRAFLAPKP